MIKKKITIISAKCDACKRNLLTNYDDCENYQYCTLVPHFSYGSKYDQIAGYTEITICEKCYEKCLKLIGLNPINYVG